MRSKNILSTIIEAKHKALLLREKQHLLESFKQKLTHSKRSLYDRIQYFSQIKQPAFIVECKKASPSKGLIRKDFNIDEILNVYEKYACGISVLTDAPFFQGDFKYLKIAQEKSLHPILCKDFFIRPYQVYEARHYGADAILLMLSVLNDSDYQSLASIAESLHLDVLTEINNENELERAIHLKAKIIGINNRNLKDLSIHLSRTEALIKYIKNTPLCFDYAQKSHPLFISESGITTHSDVQRLSPKVHGFLVGSHLMSQSNIDYACKQLLFGAIKICGVTRRNDAEMIASLGGTYCGLIFSLCSKRYISPQNAIIITKVISLKYIGVFVNEPIEYVIKTAQLLQLYAVQLHGDESFEQIERLKKALPELFIWKSFSITQKTTHKELLDYIRITPADKIVLDTQKNASKTRLYGGTGEKFDWEILSQLKKSLTHKENNPNPIYSIFQKMILAGGLNAHDIEAAKQWGFYMLDLNSGSESQPGLKSEEKLIQIFSAARKTNQGIQT
jgi:indole-3-glycerol phosphate synthase/phosphoribosylanthranilate isomerase